MNNELLKKTQEVYRELTLQLIELQKTVSTMESCTGGLISSLITDTPGASKILKVSEVTYSNEAKQLFGVPEKIIDEYGVYSENTVIEMAASARKLMNADIGIGISGSLGTFDRNNKDSIPGEVWYAIDLQGSVQTGKITLNKAESRFEDKLEVADIIGNRVLSMLGSDNQNRTGKEAF